MACPQTLSGLTRDCGSSMGGIKKAYIANFDDVASVTVTSDIVSAITMTSSAKFKKYAFRAGTGSFTSNLVVDQASGNNYVQTDIVLQFSRMETTKRVEMAALALGELALIIQDNNGKYWYFGMGEGVVASAGAGQTGTARGDGNFYQITLQANEETFPIEVDEDVITTTIIDAL